MNKDDKNRHFVLLIIDISKHGAKEMGYGIKVVSDLRQVGGFLRVLHSPPPIQLTATI